MLTKYNISELDETCAYMTLFPSINIGIKYIHGKGWCLGCTMNGETRESIISRQEGLLLVEYLHLVEKPLSDLENDDKQEAGPDKRYAYVADLNFMKIDIKVVCKEAAREFCWFFESEIDDKYSYVNLSDEDAVKVIKYFGLVKVRGEYYDKF